MKILAIFGLLGILVATGFLAVQAVTYAPAGFSALASLASRVQPQSGPTVFAVLSEPRTVQNGNSTTISWSRATQSGSYVFSYTCTEGVAVSLLQATERRGISCGAEYNLGSVTNLTVHVESEKQAYADVFFRVSFVRSRTAEIIATAQGSFLVVNQTLLSDTTQSEQVITAPETPAPTPTPPPAESELQIDSIEPSTPTPLPIRPTPPPVEPNFIYEIPTSDPRGIPDVTVRFLNVGQIARNQFVVGPLLRTQAGAVQFEVRNIGTKTSETWTYTISAPGLSFTSRPQAPLRPSERSVLAIGFPGSTVQTTAITVSIQTTVDRSTHNNQFTQPITQQ